MKSEKRHLYFDQQKPFEEPVDAEHANVRQAEFSRTPPSTEDDYFTDQDMTRRRLAQRRHASEKRRAALRQAEPADRPGSIWERITRFISGKSNTKWRP